MNSEESTENVDQYRAFMHGLNVGIELEQCGRAQEMDEEEFREWCREMFNRRVKDDD